jgi:hypothetical protein
MTLEEMLPVRISRFISEIFQARNIDFRRLLIFCVVVFAVAVGVRLLHWQNNWMTIDNTMNKMAARYQEEARFLTEGDFRSFIRGRSSEPDTGMLIHTPGYPIFIAAVHAVTRNSNLTLRLVHIAAGATAAVLLLLITVELLPAGVALLAGLFAAVSPQLSYYSLVLLSDSIIGLTLLLGMYLLVRARRQPNRWKIVGAGVCIGISCWLRANAMLLAPFLCLAIPFLFPRDRWLRYSALLILAALITIAPITIRNAIVFRSFIPLSLGTGITLMEGIADYDPERRFGLEQHDHRVCEQEAVLYNRPDYAEDLFRPDGIQRERLRVGRSWEVISGNKLWFMSVMGRRAGKMLTYERVPIISAEPTVTNSLDTSNMDVFWLSSAPDLVGGNGDPRVTLSRSGQTLIIANDDPSSAVPLATIKAPTQSDYLFSVPVRAVAGRMVIKVVRPDNGKTLASATIPDSLDPAAPRIGDLTVLRIPFVNGSADQIKLVANRATNNSDVETIEMGQIELFRLGPAGYLWTRYPRVVAKVFQKLFTTRGMLPLTLAGALLLAFARRWDALAVICAVPLYFICAHAPLHLELRYILPVHYFWGMLVATTLYFTAAAAGKLIRSTWRSRTGS